MSCSGIKSSFSWLQTWKYLGMENLRCNKDKSKISYYDNIPFLVNSIRFCAKYFVQFQDSSSGIKNLH